MSVARSSAALLVTAGLLVGVGVGAEWAARQQVEAVVRGVVDAGLRQGSGDGSGFARVDVGVDGWALVALATGRFDAVRVRAEDGVVRGVPVDRLDVVAAGVEDGGRTVESVEAILRADGGGAVASGLEPALAEAVAASAVPLPPDRLRVRAPVEVPALGEVPLDVEVLVREADGGLVVEPVRATAAGVELDLGEVDVPGGYGLAAGDLPAGLTVQQVAVVDEAGRAVVVADLACPAGCALR